MTLFANLTLEGLPELVPGRLFTTRLILFVGMGSADDHDTNDDGNDDRMPRDLVTDPGERRDWLDKCRINKLKVLMIMVVVIMVFVRMVAIILIKMQRKFKST